MKTSISGFPASSRWHGTAVLIAASTAFVTAGCGDKKIGNGATQVAAKVNNEEITVEQISTMLQQQRGVKPDQAELASRQVLERLIDQELALQKAAELRLDREPRVMQQLEAARRELLSRAYLERAAESASKATPEEVARYYEATPALFKERRIYSLQEIAIEAKPEEIARLRTRLEEARGINEFVEYLKANEIRFSASQAVRAAEQLPLASLNTFAAMKDGQAVLTVTPNGAQVIVLAGSRSQPVTLEQATAAIEQFLVNERKREVIAKDIKTLRDAARIQYVGKYAVSGHVPASDASASSSDGKGTSPVSKGGGDRQ